ncbi:MAG: NAD-dependent epimerase/dehydratase family protein [Bacteroidota bacterium]
MDKYKILLTGGAGFIGSNIAESLVTHPEVDKVVVLDNLSTGFEENISGLLKHPKFSFWKGDIRDDKTCIEASRGMNVVCHQAALGSVPRSIQNPQTTNEVNINGTLNVFHAAKENNITKVVFASSSSVYGDNSSLSKKEEVIGNPLSPYSVTKQAGELYAKAFSKSYNFNFIGLRYFNVFGPNQSPEGPYAAVIPLFILNTMQNKPSVINGDGSQSRDFTYITNVVQANIHAILSDRSASWNTIYNIAFGGCTTLLELFGMIQQVAGKQIKPSFGPWRHGDMLHSLADITKARNYLSYHPQLSLSEGLKLTYDWFSKKRCYSSATAPPL